jgi:peptidyl-dipeptidase A
MRTSRDPDELKYVWVEWRKVTGQKFRGMFEQYVALGNEAATLNSEYGSVVRYIYAAF